jgi:hypothetical protein
MFVVLRGVMLRGGCRENLTPCLCRGPEAEVHVPAVLLLTGNPTLVRLRFSSCPLPQSRGQYGRSHLLHGGLTTSCRMPTGTKRPKPEHSLYVMTRIRTRGAVPPFRRAFPWHAPQVHILHFRAVLAFWQGLSGGVISKSQGRYLQRTTNKSNSPVGFELQTKMLERGKAFRALDRMAIATNCILFMNMRKAGTREALGIARSLCTVFHPCQWLLPSPSSNGPL